MMTKDQQDTVTKVYRRFYESDLADAEWTDIDEQMTMLEWLDDNQLATESRVKFNEHVNGKPRCMQDHTGSECFVPTIIEATSAILDLYESTSNLHEKNRFILRYYLALSQVGFILF